MRRSLPLCAVTLGIVFMIMTASFAAAQQTGQPTIWLPLLANAPSQSTPTPTSDVHHGDGTYYNADGSGNCSYDPSPNDLMVGAMNHVDYANSAICGAYVEITGPKGVITVRIVDQCPECQQGDIDLSPQAFAKIADLVQGRVPISWRVISPNISGPIVYHFKDGSNQWWTAVQIRNHRNLIAKFEYRTASGAFKSVPRTDYNYFLDTSGMGPGPYTFRVTDIYGHVLTDSNIPLTADGNVSGSGQFPAP